ncbi:MarR family winged helix-turn-helix transcriptional regulator [Nocardioides sp. URHA0032]|uniref:MarR family winged helix-turn-helix transcriptional regulator n=1 Tax=Nocardioides sp. URHA0032 TaxID=1380388 RepID=UPI0006840DF9|nr:MarR family transcriptional regulator [Nocardioides sp. URHA0032]
MDEPDFGVLLAIANATFVDGLQTHMRDSGYAGFSTRTGFVLRVLGTDALSLRKVADLLEVSSPAALKVVDAMVRDGYVERVAAPGDRRVRAIRATALGHAALADARRFHADFEESLGSRATALRRGLTVIAQRASPAIPRVLREP